MQPGYPLFVPADNPPEGATLESLKAAAVEAPNDAKAQLQYGSALQGAGRRLEAVQAYTQALKADPTSIESQVALALAGFKKDDPAKAFGTVGPLVRDHANDPSPRFHLAMMLLWIGQTGEGAGRVPPGCKRGAGHAAGPAGRVLRAEIAPIRTELSFV